MMDFTAIDLIKDLEDIRSRIIELLDTFTKKRSQLDEVLKDVDATYFKIRAIPTLKGIKVTHFSSHRNPRRSKKEVQGLIEDFLQKSKGEGYSVSQIAKEIGCRPQQVSSAISSMNGVKRSEPDPGKGKGIRHFYVYSM
ncbi:MAG: hypothetical protein ACOX2U_01325 [Limisphaerales bacterium]|jgi:hypothetical protein|nr:hypothetical protein [Verrucomicrobiota bacterium]